MRRFSAGSKLIMIPLLAAFIVLLPNCGRAPEEPAVSPTIPAPQEELEVLELPQQNTQIGISLTAAPQELAVTYNGKHWMELTDKKRHSLRYTFIESVPDSPGLSPTSVQEFQTMISAYEDGKILESGSVDTALGNADWSNGTYSEDGEVLDILTMFSAHPADSRILILRSVCPTGLATVEERLSVMQELLANIS